MEWMETGNPDSSDMFVAPMRMEKKEVGMYGIETPLSIGLGLTQCPAVTSTVGEITDAPQTAELL